VDTGPHTGIEKARDGVMYLKELGEIRQHSNSFLKKLNTAKSIVRQAFSQCKSPYVAVSGGKDSIAMLGIVNDVANESGRQFSVWSHLSDASFPGTLETIEEACRQIEAIPEIDWSPVSAFEVVTNKIQAQFGKKGYFFSAIENYVKLNNKDLAFVGVRAGESHRRARACKIHGSIFKTKVPSPITVCYPLIYFDVFDVAGAICHYNLPFHPVYSKVPVDGNKLNIRLGYLTAKDLLHMGSAVFIRLNYPELYMKLRQAYPEISQYS